MSTYKQVRSLFLNITVFFILRRFYQISLPRSNEELVVEPNWSKSVTTTWMSCLQITMQVLQIFFKNS